MKCGKGHDHKTVSEVRACYGLADKPKPEQEPVSEIDGPSDKQWEFYKSLGEQLGRHVHDGDRRLFSRNKISGLIEDMLIERRSKPPKQVANSSMPEIPEGRYATPSITGNNDLDFFKIDCPTEGRWAGYMFINRVVGGKPDMPVRGPHKAKALQAILDFGIDKSQVLFGTELGQCWRCGRHLTDETSRALGIGPDCRAKES
jgi:hypothetical protein